MGLMRWLQMRRLLVACCRIWLQNATRGLVTCVCTRCEAVKFGDTRTARQETSTFAVKSPCCYTYKLLENKVIAKHYRVHWQTIVPFHSVLTLLSAATTKAPPDSTPRGQIRVSLAIASCYNTGLHFEPC